MLYWCTDPVTRIPRCLKNVRVCKVDLASHGTRNWNFQHITHDIFFSKSELIIVYPRVVKNKGLQADHIGLNELFTVGILRKD